MPMGIGPGLSVTRFESGIPGWMTGMDLGWDFTQNVQYSGATNPTDTHSAAINAQFAAGGWSPFAANTLVRTDLGLQTVPTRTNSIRNNSMVGAVAGSPGTLPTNWGGIQCSVQVVALGTVNGIGYIDLRVTRTNSSGGNEFPQVYFEGGSGGAAASVGQVWTASSWTQILSGSAPSTSISLREQISGSYLANSETTFGSTFTRTIVTRTFNQATVNQANVSISFGLLPNLQAMDVTVRIGWPQLEQGAFATPPIVTTSSSATVNGNQQVVDLTGNVGGIIQYTPIGIVSFGNSIAFTDGAAVQAAIEYGSTSGPRILAKGANSGETAVRANSRITVAFAFSEGYQAIQQIGGSKVTQTATSLSITKMAIGGSGIAATANLYQTTQRLAIKRGVQNDATFNDLVAKATILAAVS